VWLRGEHDITTVRSLARDFARAIAANDDDVVLDLSAVRFMDAATVGMIVGAENFLRPRSRSVLLRDPSASARRVLDLCGLAYDTRSCARGSPAFNRVER
jgi:anti-anti-sigma factor